MKGMAQRPHCSGKGWGYEELMQFLLSPPHPPTHTPVPHTLQKMVLSSGSGLELDLPLVLGLPLQLKLAVSRVILTQGYKKEILALPALHLGFLLNLWAQPQGFLFLGALPGKTVLFMFLSTQLEVARGRGEDRQVCVFRGKEMSGKEEERPQEERGI